MKFTDKYVQSLQPKAKVYTVREPGGFVIKITPAGKRVFQFVYDIEGKRRRLTFGHYPRLSLAGARKQFKEARAMVDLGHDPAAEKQAVKQATVATRDALTVGQLIDRYIALRVNQLGNPRFELRYMRMVRDALGERPLASITPVECNALYEAVAVTAPVDGNRLLGAIKRLFKFAVQKGDLTLSPAALLGADYKEKPRQRALTEEEIRILWRSLSPDNRYHVAIKLYLLTGVRKMELLGARRSEINLESGVWTLPAARVKNNREHVLPLSTMAVELMAWLMQYDDSEWLFPSVYDEGRKPVSRDALRVSGLPGCLTERWTLHDLRRSLATHLGKMGVNRLIQDRILNHVDRSVGAVYDVHDYTAEARDALQRWSEKLGELVR